MPNIKTAISVEAPLFAEIEALAGEMKVSRSRLFSLAARDFLERRKNRKMLAELNSVYRGSPEPAEEILTARMKPLHRRLVKDQW